MTPAEQFEDNLSLIEGVIAFVARRQHVSVADRDDFASYAHLKLIENDYRILRQFADRSSLRTFLVAVVHRLFLDFRISQWGKWRPSAEARRLGPLAVQLERLLTRERLSFDEAAGQLQSQSSSDVSRAELEELARRLPPRLPRQRVSDEVLDQVAVIDSDIEGAVLRGEHAGRRVRASAALLRALARLEPQDRLLIRLRYQSGLTMPRIATILQGDAKPLYRRMERLLRQLRTDLEDAGVDSAEVHELFVEPDDVRSVEVVPIEARRGGGAPRPSI